MPKVRRETAALTAGLLWPLAFAPIGWWPVGILSLAAFFVLLDDTGRWLAARTGFAFGLGVFGMGVWWVFVSIHEFGGLHWLLAGGITLALILLMSVYIATLAWAVTRWLPARGMARWVLGLPAAWVLLEWFRSWFLSGFGWLTLGYAFTDAPLGGLAPLGGVLAASIAAALTAGAIGFLVCERPRWKPTAAIVLVVMVTWAVAAWSDRHEHFERSGITLTVALLQGNIGQDRKWDPGELLPTIRLYDGMTAAHLDADVVVWPEAALPALRYQLEYYLETLAEIAEARNTAIVMGMLSWDPGPDRYYNGVIALGAGEGEYAKRHLVPFGEFFPVPGFVRSWLRMMNLPYSDFARGARDQPSLQVRGHRVAASICYEAAYGATLIRSLPDAQLLVNVSNDAWFGDTIAPHQHLQIARQRAREAGRWMLRATNTGVTAVIGPDGRVHGRLPQFEAGTLRAEVEVLDGTTVYARFRDLPVLLLCLLMLGSAVRIRYS